MQPHTTRTNYGSERGWARGALLAVIGAVVAMTALLGGTRPAQALPPWIVNDAGDTMDVAPGDGACKTATSSCTLRAAIMEANAWAGSESILFAIPGGGVHTILPGFTTGVPLPSITPGAVIIDGTSQPGYAGTPLIEIQGSFAGAGANGIALVSAGNTVRGLAINRFGFAGIHVALGSTGNTITSNYVGTDPTGSFGIPNGTGIALYGSTNTVGGVLAVGNLISGNLSGGVLIDASGGNAVSGNRIGTNAAGTAAVGNTFGVQIRNGATSNVIGDGLTPYRNIISGNTAEGVRIDGAATTMNFVVGNAIGTDATGTAAIPNAVGVLVSGAWTNHIGCGSAGCFSPNYGNLISGNTFEGLHLTSGASSNTVQGNGIGVNVAGTGTIPNGGVGLLIDGGAYGNSIGGSGGYAGGDRNFISGNGGSGVVIDGVGATDNEVIGAYIGTDGQALRPSATRAMASASAAAPRSIPSVMGAPAAAT